MDSVVGVLAFLFNMCLSMCGLEGRKSTSVQQMHFHFSSDQSKNVIPQVLKFEPDSVLPLVQPYRIWDIEGSPEHCHHQPTTD